MFSPCFSMAHLFLRQNAPSTVLQLYFARIYLSLSRWFAIIISLKSNLNIENPFRLHRRQTKQTHHIYPEWQIHAFRHLYYYNDTRFATLSSIQP